MTTTVLTVATYKDYHEMLKAKTYHLIIPLIQYSRWRLFNVEKITKQLTLCIAFLLFLPLLTTAQNVSISSITPTDVTCNGAGNGSVDVKVNGNHTPFVYKWSTGASTSTNSTTNTITGLSGGTYSVTVTDSHGNTVTASTTVSEPSAFSTSIVATGTCGGTKGALNLTVSGATSPYTYHWSNAATTQDLTSVSPATYTVTITDHNSCTTTASGTVSTSPAVTGSIVPTDEQCNGASTGAANLTPSAGTTPYSYLWNNGATTQDLSSIAAATYTVTVTDAENCTVVVSTTITQPTALSAPISGTNESCNGGSNGIANLTPTGGTPGYTYSWNTGATTQDLSSITAGTYTVTLTDNNSCTTTGSVNITQPTALTANISSTTNVKCYGASTGAATVTASGGTTTYTYLWSNAATASTISNVAANSYTVTVTDHNSCTVTATANITQPAAAYSVTITPTGNCGGSNGTVFLTVGGNTSPYTYHWSTGVTTENLTGKNTGTYTVTITDANSCTTSSSATIVSSPAVTASTVNTEVSCNGGSDGAINLTVNTGTSPYTYNWSSGDVTQDLSGIPAATYTVTITDSKLCTVTNSETITQPTVLTASISSTTEVKCYGASTGGATAAGGGGTSPYAYVWSTGASTASISGQPAGTYTVTVTDNKGCTATTSVTLTQPAAGLSAPITPTEINCYGQSTGAASVSVSGGTSPYAYLWTGGATTAGITGKAAGTYTITVTDHNSCTLTNSVTLTQPSAALSGSIVGTNVTICYGDANGAANLTPSGGTPSYTYSWTGGATTQDLSNIAAGTYTVTITDNNSCTATSSVTLTQPTAVTAPIVGTNVSCNGGSNGVANLTPGGGTPGYTYIWNTGATTQDLNNIVIGTYTVTVTDNNSCTTTGSVNITQPTALTANISSTTNVKCYGASTGAATVTAGGGTTPYTYLWSNAATASTISNVAANSYTVTVTDHNSCTVTATANITQPAAAYSVTITPTGNCGGSNGTVFLTVGGNTSPYTYHWSTGVTTENLTGKNTGTYTVTITDANSCTTSSSATIVSSPAVTASTVNTEVSCNGGSDGAINLTVNTGTSPYTYNWSSGDVTQDLSGIAAGTYTVTITDSKLCTVTNSETITQPTVLTASISSTTEVKCYGASTGGATAAGGGGTSPYTYVWSTGASTASISGQPAGTYTVTVTDNKGCTATTSVTLTQPAAGLSAPITPTEINCYGQSTGAASVSVSGGTSPYAYLWTGGATTAGITGKAAGTYTITVTDHNSCTLTNSVTLTQPSAALSGSIVGTNVTICYGDANGAANLTPSGGTPTYTYLWTGGATTQDLSNIAAGTYTVTITDNNSCTATSSVTLTQPTAVTAPIVGTNVSCNGGSNGLANLTPGGGTPGYTYSWNTGATTQDLSGLIIGTYTVTVTDNNACTGTGSVTITQPTVLTANITSTTEVKCNGASTGAATVTAGGGTTPYTYLWSNAATASTASNLAAGTYTVTVTDHNSCTATTSVTITQPTAISPTISGINVNCVSCTTGSVNLSVTGGTSPYTYLWSNAATTQNLSGVAAGTYVVTITDHNSCTSTASITLTEITAAIAGLSTCTGSSGTATLTVTGGTTPYTYLWSNGATTQNLTNLNSGTYVVTVTDAWNTTVSQTVTINNELVTLTLSSNATICNGKSAQLTASGATSYAWTPSTGLSNASISNPVASPTTTTTYSLTGSETSGQLISNGDFSLGNTGFTSGYQYISAAANAASTTPTPGQSGLWPQATYAVDTNANTYHPVFIGHAIAAHTNFMIVNGATVIGVTVWAQTVSVTPNTVYNFSTWVSSLDTVDQNFAKLSFSVNGTTIGTPITGPNKINTWIEFSTTWNSGSNTSAQIAIVNEDTVAGGNDFGLDDISFTTTCTNNTADSVTVTVNPLPSPSITPTNVDCHGNATGDATLSVTGGDPTYIYAWSNSATTQNLTNVVANTYTVTVTDQNSCSATATTTITQPAVLSGSIVGTNVSCYGGSNGTATLTVSGGTTAYTYLWTGGATTQNLSNLVAGTYTVTVTDAHNCSTTASVTITQPSAPLSASITPTNILCNGASTGAATLSVSGGTTAYTYLWSNGATTQNLTAKPAGTYTVTVTDHNSCVTTTSTTLTQPTAIAPSITPTNVSCHGGSNGAATLSVPGGTSPYAFHWSNSATTQNLTNLTVATYSVTVTDHNSCTASTSTTITQPNVLSPTIVGTNDSCNGQSNGTATLTVTGGTPSYTYLWTGGITTQNLGSLSAATYTVTVTDNNSCTATSSVTITQPAVLTSSVTPNNVSCYGGTNGSTNNTVSGGTSPYTYLWSTGATTQNISGKPVGTYSVSVTDHNACSTTASVTITQPAAPLSNTTTVTEVNCNGQSNGAIAITVSGGTTPYSYHWSNFQSSSTDNNLSAGTYTCTVTDNNGCSITSSATVTQPAVLGASISGTNISCHGGSDGTATLTVTGGNTSFTYHWSNSATTQNLSNVTAGTYSVTVTDNKGCTATASTTLTQPSAALSASISGTNITCNGLSNGAATLTVSGGTTAYTYLWSNSATTQNLSGLAANTYTVTVTDAHSCTTTTSTTLTQPAVLSGSIVGTNILCNGASTGAATLTVTGGTTAYSYLWSNSATTQNLNSITAGTYTVTVTDAHSCIANASVTLTQPSAALSASIVGTNILCNGASTGAATLTVTGGVTAYNYLWTGGATTQNLNNIVAGTYTVTVTDANNCTTNASTTITQPAALSASIAGTNVSCNGNGNGSTNLSVSGGTVSYTYLWSTGATTLNINNLVPATYTVTVTDAHSCSTTSSVTITQPAILTVSAISTNKSKLNHNDGTVTLTVGGGTTAYGYTWSNSATTQNLTGLNTGTYNVTVTDYNNCTATASATVINPTAPCSCIATGLWRSDATWTGLCSGGGGVYAGTLDSVMIQGYRVTVDSIHSVLALVLRESALDTTMLLGTGTGQLTVLDTLYMNTLAAGKDIKLSLNGTSDLFANTDVVVNHSDGHNVNIFLNDQNGSAAKLQIAGNLTLNLNSGAQNILVETYGANDTIKIGGNLNLNNYVNSITNLMQVILNSSSTLIVAGNINFNPTRDQNTLLVQNGTSTLQLQGAINRPSGNPYGKLNAASTATLVLYGSSQQILAPNTGAGADNLVYGSITVNKTGGAKVTLNSNITALGKLNIANGIFEVPANMTATVGKFSNSSSGVLNVLSNGTLKIP